MRRHQGIKVAFLTRYDCSRASSRARVYSYLPYLHRMGFACKVLPFPNEITIFTKVSYVARALWLARWANVVVLQKLVLQERFVDMLVRINPRLVFDFDDALWAPPDALSHDLNVQVRHAIQAQRLRHIFARALAVIAGSWYLASYAKQFTHHVKVIPSSIDLKRYPVKSTHNEISVTLGWIGSSENLVDLNAIAPVLRRVAGRRNISIKVVSSYPPKINNVPIQFERWELQHEIDYLHSFDIGLMPLNDTERSRGRCGFKAVQYMAVGLPVVASNVGAAPEVVVHKKTGFLATSEEEWQEFLEQLVLHKDLRVRMGRAGRELIERHFSIQANVHKLATILREVAFL